MKKTLKDLTPEIMAKIPEYKDAAVNDLYNGNEYANWKYSDTEQYIHYVYKLGGQTEMPVVIVANTLNEYKWFYNRLFNDKMNKDIVKVVNFF